jgi:hypothetical protein
MGATLAPGNQTIRDRTSMTPSGSSVIRARILNTPRPRRDSAILPTSEPTKNACTPKGVLQAVEEDD